MITAKRPLPETARIGRIRLAISDLERSMDVYTRVLGLSVQAKSHCDEASSRDLMGCQMSLLVASAEKFSVLIQR